MDGTEVDGTEDEFVRAIRERPDDEAVRLRFADWLDKHRQTDRGEFIRTQCAAAQEPRGSPQAIRLEARARELLDRHRQEWTRAIRDAVPDINPDMVLFERGLPHMICTRAERYLRDPSPISRLVESDPLLGLNLFPDDEEQLRKLVACPSLAAVHTLDLGAWEIGDAGARILAGCPHLAGLKSLNLSSNQLGDTGLAALADSPTYRDCAASV